MYVLAHEDLASVISETDKGEEILVLFWAHDQVGEEADENTPDDERFEAVEYKSATELIPVVEAALRMGVPEVLYGLLPFDDGKAEPDAKSMNALGREPIADFLLRLQERKAQEDQAGHN